MPTPSREHQQRARIFGVLFAVTFVTSIAALLLYDPILNDADYILGDGADTRIQLGALCEILLAITNIGTAVVLWPIVRRQSDTLALSYVASRVVEAIIVVGLISLLSVVTLRQDFAGAGADAGSLTLAGNGVASDEQRQSLAPARRLLLQAGGAAATPRPPLCDNLRGGSTQAGVLASRGGSTAEACSFYADALA